MFVVTRQENDEASNPYRYQNHLSQPLIIAKHSEIALHSAYVNRGEGAYVLEKELVVSVFHGVPLPDVTEAEGLQDPVLDSYDNESVYPTVNHPFSVAIPPGTYSPTVLAAQLQESLNTSDYHPAFAGKWSVSYNAVVNADGFRGFKIEAVPDYDYTTKTDDIEFEPSEGLQLSDGGLGGGVSITRVDNQEPLVYKSIKTVNSVNSIGGRADFILSGVTGLGSLVGLVRAGGIPEGLDIKWRSNLDKNFQHRPYYDTFFDYAVESEAYDNNGVASFKIKLLQTTFSQGRSEIQEVIYWDEDVAGGTTLEVEQLIWNPATHPFLHIQFEVDYQRIIVQRALIATNGGADALTILSENQLKCITNSTSNMKGIIGLLGEHNGNNTAEMSSMRQPNVNDANVNWDKSPGFEDTLAEEKYAIEYPLDFADDAQAQPYWNWMKAPAAGGGDPLIYFSNYIAVNWKTVLIMGNASIDYNCPKNSTVQPALGFKDVVNLSSGTYPTNYEFLSSTKPKGMTEKNMYVRLGNLPVRTFNGVSHSQSQIVGTIPRFSDEQTTGQLFYEPQNLMYLKLNNPRELHLNQLSVEIVNSDETPATDLQDFTAVHFHIK